MWDLDGLVSVNELSLDDSDVEFLILNYKLSESYTRAKSFSLSDFKFTTTEEIYNKTGIYAISFREEFRRVNRFSFSNPNTGVVNQGIVDNRNKIIYGLGNLLHSVHINHLVDIDSLIILHFYLI